MGCERSERRKPDMASMHFLRKFSYTLKPEQPHPNPPLLTQWRESDPDHHEHHASQLGTPTSSEGMSPKLLNARI